MKQTLRGGRVSSGFILQQTDRPIFQDANVISKDIGYISRKIIETLNVRSEGEGCVSEHSICLSEKGYAYLRYTVTLLFMKGNTQDDLLHRKLTDKKLCVRIWRRRPLRDQSERAI